MRLEVFAKKVRNVGKSSFFLKSLWKKLGKILCQEKFFVGSNKFFWVGRKPAMYETAALGNTAFRNFQEARYAGKS